MRGGNTILRRLRWAWRSWKRRPRLAVPTRDIEAEEIAKVETLIRRLEIAARIGSMAAAGRLADMAEDRIGRERRRLAIEALNRLRDHSPSLQTA
jgi:hypothetical protein